MAAEPLILLTGATGYVGGRLLRALEARGHRVRCLARQPEHLRGRVGSTTEVARGDLTDRPSLGEALRGVHTAYYLVHSMGRKSGFADVERESAVNFAVAARAAGVRRIVYLGGLADANAELSPHLRSRLDTGARLRDSGVEVIEFRASIVIGSGSLSFEMIRALVERLPVMITPTWVRTLAQPIAIDDVIAYLTAALDLEPGAHRVFEIGGPDVVTYGDLMREYARQRGLHRRFIAVPALTPRLSSLWLGLVTPIFARVGRKLIDSIRFPSVVRDRAAAQVFDIQPIGVREAIARARADDGEARASHWSDARSSSESSVPYGGVRVGNRLIDHRSIRVAVPPAQAFAPIQRIGGRTGWYYGQWLWRLRGWLDLLTGGVGMRRGRRHPERLLPGDVVDCWRVLQIAPGESLRLGAEMRLPGRAWLDFLVTPDGDGARITQTATFDPMGLTGLLYWYGIWPLHRLVFAGMLRGIARAAERGVGQEHNAPLGYRIEN